MANSGSFGGNGVGSKGNYCFVNWQVAGQEIGNNRTLINWQFYAHFNNSDNQLDNGVVNTNVGNVYSNGGRIKNFQGTYTTRDVGISSGSFWVGHDGAGNGAVQFGIGLDYYGDGRSQGTSGVWGLPTIPRNAYLTAAPDVTDEDDPWLDYSNPAGGSNNMYDVWLEINPGNTHLAIRQLGTSGGGRLNWGLTNTERDQLRAMIPNANSATIRYGFYNSVTGGQASIADRTYYIINANPTFADYTYRDKNAATVAVTGNDQYMIQGQSELELTISAANKAAALKAATMIKYNAAISSVSQDIAYATTALVQSLGVIGANADTPLVVNAIDSRGNQTGVTKTVKVLPYVVPQITATATRLNNFETQTKLHIEGVISRLTVGSTDKNAVVAASGVQYRYKKTTDSTWGAWTNVVSSTTGGNVSTTDFNVNLDRAYAWNIQVKLTDKINTTTVDLLLSVGIPIFRVSTYDNLVYNNEQPLMPSHIGMIITSVALDTAAKVQALYGGTWAAWSVGRSPIGVDTTQTEFNTVEKTGGEKAHVLSTGELPRIGAILSHHGDEGGSVVRQFSAINGYSGAVGYPGAYKAPPGSTGGAGSIQSPSVQWGDNVAHNVLHPYTTAYMWKRTA